MDRLYKAIEHIENNLLSPLRVADIACIGAI